MTTLVPAKAPPATTPKKQPLSTQIILQSSIHGLNSASAQASLLRFTFLFPSQTPTHRGLNATIHIRFESDHNPPNRNFSPVKPISVWPKGSFSFTRTTRYVPNRLHKSFRLGELLPSFFLSKELYISSNLTSQCTINGFIQIDKHPQAGSPNAVSILMAENTLEKTGLLPALNTAILLQPIAPEMGHAKFVAKVEIKAIPSCVNPVVEMWHRVRRTYCVRESFLLNPREEMGLAQTDPAVLDTVPDLSAKLPTGFTFLDI